MIDVEKHLREEHHEGPDAIALLKQLGSLDHYHDDVHMILEALQHVNKPGHIHV